MTQQDTVDARKNPAGPRPERPVDIYRRATANLEACLPLGWTLSSDRPRSSEVPARLLITAPDGDSASFAVIVSRSVLSGDVARIMAESTESDRGFVCAHYLSDPVRRQLDRHGISYADATGNLALVATRSAVWVRNRGADADPWRGPGRPSGVLTGEPSDRVVRALADHSGAITVRELIALAGASTGATYRVVEVLVELVDIPYALTGLGSTDYADPALVEVYADHPDDFGAVLGLRPVDRGGDVVVAIPWSPVVFDRMERRSGLRHAAPSHVYADLLTGSFRNTDAAEHLLLQLASDEARWRRPVR